MMVTPPTNSPTKISSRGTLPNRRKLPHSKVFSATTNITPISAAKGISSIHSDKNRMKAAKNMAVAIPDKRLKAPLLMLIILWPIMAQPPIPPKNPVTILANP